MHAGAIHPSVCWLVAYVGFGRESSADFAARDGQMLLEQLGVGLVVLTVPTRQSIECKSHVDSIERCVGGLGLRTSDDGT